MVRLLRPLNLLMFVGGVIVGGLLAAGETVFTGESLYSLLVAALSVAAIGAGSNSFNDVCDVTIDRVNRPERPIPAGLVSVRLATGMWLFASVVGLSAAALVSPEHLLIAAIAVLALVLYNLRLKRVLLAGNLLVSALVAVSLVFGALAVEGSGAAFFAAAFAFLLTFVREVVKDVEDARGDSTAAARTLPLVVGNRAAVRVATAVAFVVVLLTPIPFLLLDYSSLYLSIVLAADAVIVGAVWWALSLDQQKLRRSSSWLKWAMILGMLALAAAQALE